MKFVKPLCLLFFSVTPIILHSQESITFEKYEYERTEEDGCSGWKCGKFAAIKIEPKVIQAPGLSAEELYTKTKKWINETYKGGTDIILGDNENEYIRFEGKVDDMIHQVYAIGGGTFKIPVFFQVEIRFREGRYRWEYISWRPVTEGFAYRDFFTEFKLINKRGKPVNPDYITTLLKTQAALPLPIISLTNYIINDNPSDDDW